MEVIPGPTACITALVSSGIACDHFFFEGFLPRKAGERARRLAELAPVPGALLFYESPHRVGATLDALAVAFPAREAALCRELTKLHEEVLRGTAVELASEVAQREETGAPLKGEMVIVVAPPALRSLRSSVVCTLRAWPRRKGMAPQREQAPRSTPTRRSVPISSAPSRRANRPTPSPSVSRSGTPPQTRGL